MRQITLLLLFTGMLCSGQIGINTDVPSAASALDINAQLSSGSIGGLLLRPVTVAQRNLVAVDASSEGTLLFVDKGDDLRCMQVYDAVQSVWQDVYCINAFTQPIISEYVEGTASQRNNWIELYNPTTQPIVLDGNYKIVILRNGGNFPLGASDREVTLTGTIPPLSTFVIENASAGLGFQIEEDLLVPNNNFDFNGDDPVLLTDADLNIIDAIGIPGTIASSGYAVDGVNTTTNQTIRRNLAIMQPNSSWSPNEWTAVGANVLTGLGTR